MVYLYLRWSGRLRFRDSVHWHPQRRLRCLWRNLLLGIVSRAHGIDAADSDHRRLLLLL